MRNTSLQPRADAKAIAQASAKTILFLLLLLIHTSSYTQPIIGYQPVITGLNQPMEVVTAPGDATGRLFIVGKTGVIRVWDGATLLPTPFLDISGIVEDTDEHGLLSMAFHPQYQTNGFFYVFFNNNAGNIVINRYFATPGSNTANAGSALELFNVSKPFSNHNGCHLQFRVISGTNYLYFATGDGGSANDPGRRAQNQSSLLGKMLRMNVDLPTPVPEIWAWGLRNPFRWSFDRANGDIWIGDVGQGLKEEVNRRPGGTFGANYGWPCFEGTLTNGAGQTGSQCDTVAPVHVSPVLEYDNPTAPNNPSSVVGGFVYRGTEYPNLAGYYMAVDFYSGNLYLIAPGGGSSVQAGLPTNISSISETNDGSTLYVTSLANGSVSKLVEAVPTPVTLLSFSGTVFTGRNELKWTVADERDIQKYIIEYSSNARDYQSAGEIIARNVDDGGRYSFQHLFLNTSETFYRLKIMEAGGRFTYSPIISLGKANGNDIKVYPNIVTSGSVNIISSRPIDRLELIGSDGRRVLARDAGGQSGYLSLPLPAIAKGMYYLRIAGKDWFTTEKLFIQ
jgi:glucose/arabinose dehydrogenase